jgi:hypothetical protein
VSAAIECVNARRTPGSLRMRGRVSRRRPCRCRPEDLLARELRGELMSAASKPRSVCARRGARMSVPPADRQHAECNTPAWRASPLQPMNRRRRARLASWPRKREQGPHGRRAGRSSNDAGEIDHGAIATRVRARPATSSGPATGFFEHTGYGLGTRRVR